MGDEWEGGDYSEGYDWASGLGKNEKRLDYINWISKQHKWNGYDGYKRHLVKRQTGNMAVADITQL